MISINALGCKNKGVENNQRIVFLRLQMFQEKTANGRASATRKKPFPFTVNKLIFCQRILYTVYCLCENSTLVKYPSSTKGGGPIFLTFLPLREFAVNYILKTFTVLNFKEMEVDGHHNGEMKKLENEEQLRFTRTDKQMGMIVKYTAVPISYYAGFLKLC